MARWSLFALTVGALLVLQCITTANTAPDCLFSKRVDSKVENELKGMILDDCIVKGNEKSTNTSYCKSHTELTAVHQSCICGGYWDDINTHLDCDVTICCKNNLRCLNGGTLNQTLCRDGYHLCRCKQNFHGKRCELVDVKRECSLITNDSMTSCVNAGEDEKPCLHIVNKNSFVCDSPIQEPEVHELPKCSEIPEGGLETLTPAVNSVTVSPGEGPVTSKHWSDWSPCSMANDAVSGGPCMCRKRECSDGSCQGAGVEVSNCTEHGHWTDWTPWSACSATRGRKGERTRYRFCSNPAPKYGGRPCSGRSGRTDVETDGRSDNTDVQTDSCSHDCPVSGSELQMTEFSSWANMTFEEGVPGWLRVRTKLVCQAPGGELEGLDEEEVARACYLLKVSVEHCHPEGCAPLKGLRKLIDKSSASDKYKPPRPIVKPDN